jgi:prepilin-type N-terminal cleavage/methylation domain-containing protein
MISHFSLSLRTKGFTLVETLVAITVLLFAVAGPLSIAARSLFASNVARDEITAFYLTQQAMETVRNLRDQNVLRNLDWKTGFNECTTGNSQGGNSCVVEATDNTIIPCSAAGCPVIRYSTDGDGIYGYNSSWKSTRYTITVQITTLDANKELSIRTQASWYTGGIIRSFYVRENILKWE